MSPQARLVPKVDQGKLSVELMREHAKLVPRLFVLTQTLERYKATGTGPLADPEQMAAHKELMRLIDQRLSSIETQLAPPKWTAENWIKLALNVGGVLACFIWLAWMILR